MRKVIWFVIKATLVYWALTLVIGIYRYVKTPPADTCPEYSELDSVSQDYFHQRRWVVYNFYEQECVRFETQKAEQERAREERTSFPHPAYTEDHYEVYWQEVYHKLSRMESPVLDRIRDSLWGSFIDRGLDPYETATIIVSMIQDIPYALIKSDDCTTDDSQPCFGNEKFGLLSPTEFMYDLHGDCDTRAVLLYKLLNELGYRTIIVISREYTHAMIATNLPAAGDYIEYQGIPYYFWETTADGWSVGMLPPSYTDLKYWRVALGPQGI